MDGSELLEPVREKCYKQLRAPLPGTCAVWVLRSGNFLQFGKGTTSIRVFTQMSACLGVLFLAGESEDEMEAGIAAVRELTYKWVKFCFQDDGGGSADGVKVRCVSVFWMSVCPRVRVAGVMHDLERSSPE